MNRKGDKSKQPSDCDEYKCENMKEDSSDFKGKQYYCEVCGAAYYLDYDDWK